MNIALIGYGKMGQLIEKIAVGRGNTISKIIDVKNIEEIADINANNTDVAIEFTGPDSAFNNIMAVLNQKVSVVSGSTGWLDNKGQVEDFCNKNEAAFFMLPILA